MDQGIPWNQICLCRFTVVPNKISITYAVDVSVSFNPLWPADAVAVPRTLGGWDATTFYEVGEDMQ